MQTFVPQVILELDIGAAVPVVGFYSNCAPDKKHFQIFPNINRDKTIIYSRAEKNHANRNSK